MENIKEATMMLPTSIMQDSGNDETSKKTMRGGQGNVVQTEAEEAANLPLVDATHGIMHEDDEFERSSRSAAISQVKNNANKRTKQQFSSALLFVIVIITLNLCPFNPDFEQQQQPTTLNENSRYLTSRTLTPAHSNHHNHQQQQQLYRNQYLPFDWNLEACIGFVRLMFTNPIRLGKRSTTSTRFYQAEAKMLGKMAKMWYIKKKIKKLSKKLKKHTIAVPVFTAIPIYEHSYYPQPHVTHVSHGAGLHHAAAASSPIAYSTAPFAAAMQQSQQQQAAAAATAALVAAASSNHQQVAPSPFGSARQSSGTTGGSSGGGGGGGGLGGSHYHPHASGSAAAAAHYQHSHPGGGMHQASNQHIINAYAPSPPLYVDEAGGLYGHYGNAYGRYDGGYHIW